MREGIPPLAGWTVAVTAERRREEFGSALQRHGADVLYGQAIRIVPLEEDGQLRTATQLCLDGIDHLVATTAVGVTGWLDAAAGWGLRDRLLAVLSRATILTRGPKVRGAVRAAGLHEAWSPASESMAEVLDQLLSSPSLHGARVAVQLHGDPSREFLTTLRERGAEVIELPLYRWEPPADPAPLHRVIERTARRSLGAVAFTSAPAAINFLATADALGCGATTRASLRGAVGCAAVGTVTAAPLLAAGLHVDQPERHRLGALIRLIVDTVPARAVAVRAGGREVEIRGGAVVLDGRLVEVAEASAAVLRELARRPGEQVGRDRLLRALGVDDRDENPDVVRGDGDLVDRAVDGIGPALGDARLVQRLDNGSWRLAADT